MASYDVERFVEDLWTPFSNSLFSGLGSLLAARRRASRFQNGRGSGGDAGRALIGDFLFGFQPVLNVTTAELRAFKAQRFAANERDGLGLATPSTLA